MTPATSAAPTTGGRASGPDAAAVGPEDDVRVEDADERLEVAGARRREEGVDDATLDRQVGVRVRRALADPAARPARQLAGRGRRLPDDLGDLVERHREDVVEHERQALGGA